MSWDVVYLLFLVVVMGGLAARDAWRDRTPRKAFEWRRPELEWWAVRRSRHEHRHVVKLPARSKVTHRRRS